MEDLLLIFLVGSIIFQLFNWKNTDPTLSIFLGLITIVFSINLNQENMTYITEEMYSKQPNILENCNPSSKTILKYISEDKFYIKCDSREIIEVDKNIYDKYKVTSTEKETFFYKIGMFFMNTSNFILFVILIVIAVIITIFRSFYEKLFK